MHFWTTERNQTGIRNGQAELKGTMISVAGHELVYSLLELEAVQRKLPFFLNMIKVTRIRVYFDLMEYVQ